MRPVLYFAYMYQSTNRSVKMFVQLRSAPLCRDRIRGILQFRRL